MIIVAGELRIATSDRDAYLAGVREVAALARQSPGCHDFVQSADPLDPERIVIYERWESDAALSAFRDREAQESGELPEIRGADVAKYRISAVESP